MPQLRIHASDRSEALLEVLAGVLVHPLASPLDQELICVQDHAMGRWLALRLADRFGIWAHARYLSPDRLVAELLAALLPEQAQQAWEPAALGWAIYRLLPDLLDEPGFEPVRGYLASDDGAEHLARKRHQLSARLAGIFSRYLGWRPGMLAAWEEGRGTPDPPQHWQPRLWRALCEQLGPMHPAALLRQALQALQKGAEAPGRLPQRLSVFAPATLTPGQARLLQALSDHCPIHIFLAEPAPPRGLGPPEPRSRRRKSAKPLPESQVLLPFAQRQPPSGKPSPLARSLARSQRQLRARLEKCCPGAAWRSLHSRSPVKSQLALLQQALVRSPATPGEPDDSLALHSCHGPLREVEALRDQLLAIFDQPAAPSPQQVLVMAPDIERYAPLVEAVFGGDEGAGDGRAQRIPFSLCDHARRSRSALLEAFSRALDLAGSRLPATALLDLLACPPVHARYGIGSDELDNLRTWVADTGIRWGRDASHRGNCGQPAREENTWRFGLDRLILGYALPDDDQALFAGIAPHDPIEGRDANLLGRFAQFCEALLEPLCALEEARPASRWGPALGQLAEALGGEELPAQRRFLAEMLGELTVGSAAAGLEEDLPFAVLRDHLQARLGEARRQRGFLQRGVSFASLEPGRCIPFEVVCLLGMDDGAFPREATAPAFDLMAAQPLPGEPSPRDRDRSAFCEALLAARERLHISYVGQSLRGPARYPPSVVVEELLDGLGPSLDQEQRAQLRRRLELRHPLQPFSPRLFQPEKDSAEPRLFSYAARWCRAAGAVGREPGGATPFLPRPLAPPPADESRTQPSLDIAELARFLTHPARTLLQRRLGLFADDEQDILEDREPFSLDALQSYLLKRRMAEDALQGEDLASAWPRYRALGALPLGTPGEMAYERNAADASALAAQVQAFTNSAEPGSLPLRLEVDGWQLGGSLTGLWPAGLLRFRPASIKAQDLLSAWVVHLALCASPPRGPARSTTLLGLGAGGPQRQRFGPVPDAAARLGDLLELYQQGQLRPLRLFPRSALAWARSWQERPGDLARAYAAAERTWSYWNPHARQQIGEHQDPYIQRAFGHEAAPWRTGERGWLLADLAQRVFLPLLEACLD